MSILLLAVQAPVADGDSGPALGGDPIPATDRMRAIVAKMTAPHLHADRTVHPDGMASLSDVDLADLGLRRGDGQCAGLYQPAHAVAGSSMCTHGLDLAAIHGGPYTEHPSPAGWAPPTSIPCYSSGPYVEVLWIYPTGGINRLAAMREKVRRGIAITDEIFRVSAASVNGTNGKAAVSHVRWGMDVGCKLRIRAVSSSFIGIDLVSDLEARGVILDSAKYLLLEDRGAPEFCWGGVATQWGDDARPGASNWANLGGTEAEVFPGCFDSADINGGYGASLIAHELMHTLGTVQASAPHSTGDGGHCWDDAPAVLDGADIMCYQDNYSIPTAQFYARCASTYPETFDCGKDDYFNPFPAASSYLATNWDAARNIYLSTIEPTAVDPIAGWSLTPFTDIYRSIFESDIVWVYLAGITSGCTATTYCPNAKVTRGQMAAFLSRALNLPNTAADYFTDDNGSIYENNINRVAAAGITSGCTPTTYCPNANVTRGQMAAFLHRAFGP